MKKIINIVIVLCFFVPNSLFSESLGSKKTLIENVKYYGQYTTHKEWNVVVIPQKIYSNDELIDLAKNIYLKYQGHIKIFDNTKQLKQFIDRDMFFNGKSDIEVPYPKEWANKHYIGCIVIDKATNKMMLNLYVNNYISGIDLEAWPEQKRYTNGEPIQ